MATNIQKLGDQIVEALSKPRKGGNNAMSSIIRGDEYKRVAASQVSGKNLKALQSDVLGKLGPSSKEGKAFSKLLADHQNAKTGGTFAEQFSKALRGTPVKQAAKTAKSTKPKGGAAQSYGRKMYNKMSPDQQRALQTATQGDQGSILDAVLDNSDKADFDNFLAAIDQNNKTNLFGQPAQAAPQAAKQTPGQGQTANQTQTQTQTQQQSQTAQQGTNTTQPEKSRIGKLIDTLNPVGGPWRIGLTTAGVPTGAALYRGYIGQPREQAEQSQEFFSEAGARQQTAAEALADSLLAEGGMFTEEEQVATPVDDTLPDPPPEMQLPVDDPLLFPEDNAVVTQPPKKGAKK